MSIKRLAFCTNYLEREDRPCEGYLHFGPTDIQAACAECGAWCGYLVADYVDGEP